MKKIQSKENSQLFAFPENAKFVVYKTNTKKDIIKILSENQNSIKSLKKRAPKNSYGFNLEDANHNKLPGFYIIDGEIKRTNRMSEEDRYFDREANEVFKTIGKCKQYVKTRIINLFLEFDPKNMKIV
ncbi:MAG: hypothetical protein PHR61_03850 [Candidatus Absconditabacteria bacterium]|nr:hypothetical protein [Candidatus Absconditabacteria bacterium]